MIMLRKILRQNLPEIFEKFIEFNLPFEYYFAEKLLSMFAGYFNTEMTFRIWDLIFLEGSSTDQTRSTWVLIISLYVLIRRNSERILKCNSPNDIILVLNTYAQFNMDYDGFIEEINVLLEKLFQ